MNKRFVGILIIFLVGTTLLIVCNKKVDTKGIKLSLSLFPETISDALYIKMSYEFSLNENFKQMSDEDYIIGGEYRKLFAIKGKYGTALRKYDPIAFEIGWNEWKLNNY